MAESVLVSILSMWKQIPVPSLKCDKRELLAGDMK